MRVYVGYFEADFNWWQSAKISVNKSTVLQVKWHPSGRVVGVCSSDYTIQIITAVVLDTKENYEDTSYSGIYANVDSFGEGVKSSFMVSVVQDRQCSRLGQFFGILSRWLKGCLHCSHGIRLVVESYWWEGWIRGSRESKFQSLCCSKPMYLPSPSNQLPSSRMTQWLWEVTIRSQDSSHWLEAKSNGRDGIQSVLVLLEQQVNLQSRLNQAYSRRRVFIQTYRWGVTQENKFAHLSAITQV